MSLHRKRKVFIPDVLANMVANLDRRNVVVKLTLVFDFATAGIPRPYQLSKFLLFPVAVILRFESL